MHTSSNWKKEQQNDIERNNKQSQKQKTKGGQHSFFFLSKRKS